MFLSMNWIGDFVDLSGLDKKALIKNFTLSTAEVEDIIEKGSDISGIVVAKILSVENHPESKKLHLLKVDKGDEVVDIVCGAPNVREGMKVALATVGGRVGEITIAPRTLAGYTSYGMCCSEAELGISDDHSGLIEIFEDVALGTDIKDVYDIDDIIFEVDNKSLTNRPDLWSHYGMAREFATIAKRPLKAPELLDTKQFEGLPAVLVDVKATDLVYRYSAIKVKNVTRKVSPVNMRIRLFYCGSRAINFLADLTNYVMMELGQPMHAFDNAKVDKIEVQTFPAGLCSRKIKGKVTDLEWRTNFVKKAIQYDRTIVPVHTEGCLSKRFYRIHRFRQIFGIKANLEMLFLVDEMFRQKGKNFKISFGNPIGVEELKAQGDPRQMTEYVRSKVYEMAQ